ncbi:MAG: CaiB/BaiF CoA transferase family protein [Lautropia sp.]
MVASDTQPYAGLKVLDLSQGVAGPYCAAMLGLQGARVVKVEPPSGDWVRLLGGGQAGMTALFIASNLGKQSIAIDGKSSRGRALIARMAAESDVFIENFRPGVVARLELDYETLKPANPGLVYVSITGYGDSGPWADKPGTDSVLQAFSGLAHANRDDRQRPRRLPVAVPDTVTAMYAAQSIGAALYARARTGLGRHVRLSLAECCAAFQAVPLIDTALAGGRERPPSNVPTGMFETADGYMAVLTLRDDMWQRLCSAIGRGDWLEDPRFADSATRTANAGFINDAVADILRTRPTRHWLDLLERNDVLCGEVQNYETFINHPQTRHTGCFGTLRQAPYGAIAAPFLPGTVEKSTIPPAPRVGEHSVAVLRSFDYGADEIESLISSGIVAVEAESCAR